MASGLILDYLGSGVIADRPATLDLYDGALGLWWATDTETLSAWDGTAWEDIGGGGSGMANPMTTAGDLIVGGVSGAPERLAVGSDGQILKVVSGAPAFVDPGAGDGDVVGPGASVDNTLPRFDGTGGKTLQGSGVAVSDNNEISGYRGHLNAQTGTTYTLQASDSGKIVECTNGAAITVTLPNSLPVGFCCTVVQGGAGAVTFSAASGATLRNRQSHTKTAGQWAGATLYVRTNSGGSAAEYVLNGDTAA